MTVSKEKLENSLHIDRELQEKSNPVFNTAKTTMYQLAMSGDEEATKLISAIGMTSATQSSADYKLPDETTLANNLIMETRYRTMLAMALASGCKTEINLPCGYTPRAIHTTRNGLRYVGLDLPATIEEAKDPIMHLVDPDKRSMAKFASADATNYSSVRAALEDVEGPVCITTEGLLVYLTDSEVEALCQTIRRVLEEFGGCWITPDPDCSKQYFQVIYLLAGERTMELLRTSQAVYSQKSDILVGNNFLIMDLKKPEESLKKATEKLTSFGMKAERIPIAKYMPKLRLFSKLTAEQQAGYYALNEQLYCWKITLVNDSAKGQWAEDTEDARIDAHLENGILKLSLEGRVDSLSAPHVLALYEQAKKRAAEEGASVEGVYIDCKQLAYISSAGLRVLLIMTKAHPGHVVLSHVNETVMEIFETTGFVDVFNIEP